MSGWLQSDGSRSGGRRPGGAGCRGARVPGGARACARVSALRQRQGPARRACAGPSLGRDQEPPVGAAVAACPRDLWNQPGWIPTRSSPSALHVRVRGARARWRAPACLSAATSRAGKRCREPSEPGLRAQAPWAAGRPVGGRSTPGLAPAGEPPGVGGVRRGPWGGRPAPPELRIPGEAPIPHRAGHSVGAGWGGATGQGRGLRDTFPEGGGDNAEWGCSGDSRDARERKFRDPPCSHAHLCFRSQASPCPQSLDSP